MAKKRTPKSHGCLISVLFFMIIMLGLALFIILFPTKLINIDGKEILSSVELMDMNKLNQQIPDIGNIFISVHYTDTELSALIKEQIKDDFPIDDLVISFKEDGTLDLVLTTGNIQALFEAQNIPDFLLQIITSKSIYANITITHNQGNKIDFTVNQVYLEDLSIPPILLESITNEISNKLEENLNQIVAFTIYSIKIENGTIKVDGVIKNN